MTRAIKISAIFLAAGSSRRMGEQNKLLLPYAQITLVRHCFQELQKSSIDEIVVVTGFEQDQIATQLEGLCEKFTHNQAHKTGMTSSIQTGIKSLHADAYMVCLSDMPFLRSNDYNTILQAFKIAYNDQPLIIQPMVNERRGNPAIFSHHFKKDILKHKEPEGCRAIIQQNKEILQLVKLDNPDAFKDIDTPKDYDGLVI